MGFPSKKKIENILEDLEKAEGTIVPGVSATPLEKFRFELCQRFVRYKKKHHLKQNELARILEVDEAKVSKILRNRIEEFSTDRLINLYSRLDPSVQLRVS